MCANGKIGIFRFIAALITVLIFPHHIASVNDLQQQKNIPQQVIESQEQKHGPQQQVIEAQQLTNLPTVYIDTRDGQDPYDKEHELRCSIRIIDNGVLLTDSGKVRLRGNFSKDFPKKPYHIRFDTKQQVLGSPAKAKRWTLINNYGDKSLMRNILAFDLSRRLELAYTPFVRAVDVVVNGDYKGCYQLCDQIEVKKNRVGVDKDGFLIEVDAYAYGEKAWFHSDRWTPVTIHYPDPDSITTTQSEAIRAIFNDIEQQTHPNLDRETFLRHFLVGEISGNTDTYWSMYFYKYSRNDTVFCGPVWDFDLAYENDNRTYPICSRNDYIYRTVGSYAGDMRAFVDEIVRKTADRKRLEALYAYYRDRDIISVESLTAVVDSLEELMAASAERNFERWPILNVRVHQNPRTGGSYAQEIQWIRDYIAERIPWMDSKLNYIPHPYEGLESPPAPLEKGQNEGVKIIRNGRLLILRNGKTYTAQGLEIQSSKDQRIPTND